MNTQPSRVHSLQELAQEATPARDLWPGIQSRLKPRRRSWAVPASLAASVVLVTAGVLIGLQLRGSDAAPFAVPPATGALVRASLNDNPGYQRQREELLRTLPDKLQALPPDSQQRVRESLQTIQTAMQNIENELGQDAGNVLLQELLISTSQEEMRLLTTVGYIDGFNQEI